MGKLIYLMTASLDGYVADKDGKFGWAMPTEEIHQYINDQLRNVGLILMGSNLYETMKIWDEIPTEGTSGPMDGPSPAMNDYARIWRAAKKIVYSKTLAEVTTADTALERTFDPEAIKKLVTESDRDVDIGGPHLAAEAIKAGLIDEYHLFVAPVMIGDGNPWLQKGLQAKLQLVDTHKFDNGTVHLHYRKI
jgi:dihydrofolate reductase